MAKKGKEKVGKKEMTGSVEGLIDMDQAIKILKTTRPTFYRWLRSGKIKAVKLGRQWRFRIEDIERFLRGEEPLIELRADITPLIENLSRQLREIGGGYEHREDKNKVEGAVNLMILLGYKMRASDIHITSHVREDGRENTTVLRYRVDGVLHPSVEIDSRLLSAIISQWKTMAACDTREQEKPQVGRIIFDIPDEKRQIDLRLSFLPTALGEAITVRILSSEVVKSLSLENIKYSERDKEKILKWLKAPWGMIIVSGPTGCGKTTVLYASLKYLAKPELKVMSVEDPVEVLLPWVTQIQVNPEQGVTFPVAIRCCFRSDPDVVLIGEIRDLEALGIAWQLALTGHLVLTSLHAENAAKTLNRMVDIGCEPFLVKDTTKLVISQRLVRRLCSHCSTEDVLPQDDTAVARQLANDGGLNWDSLPRKFRKAVGCSKCSGTGFRGRTVIAETLEMSHEVGKALEAGASVEELQRIAVSQGMTTLAADGIRRAAAGETTLEEVMRTLALK